MIYTLSLTKQYDKIMWNIIIKEFEIKQKKNTEILSKNLVDITHLEMLSCSFWVYRT